MTSLEKDLLGLLNFLTEEARYVDWGQSHYSDLGKANSYINGQSANSYLEARDRLAKIMVKYNLCQDVHSRPISDFYRKIKGTYFRWDSIEQQQNEMLTSQKLLKLYAEVGQK